MNGVDWPQPDNEFRSLPMRVPFESTELSQNETKTRASTEGKLLHLPRSIFSRYVHTTILEATSNKSLNVRC